MDRLELHTMIENTRRGFLKLVTTIIGGIAITKYSEPIVQVKSSHEWIEDKGDFAIVRVPDFKTFANETIAKPTIFILGQQSIVKQVDVTGFANVYAKQGGMVFGSRFDASKMEIQDRDAILHLVAENTQIIDCQLIGNQRTGIKFQACKKDTY